MYHIINDICLLKLNIAITFSINLKLTVARKRFVCLSDGVLRNFNHISAISWRSVLLVEETGVPGGKNVQVNMTLMIRKFGF